MKTHQIVFSDGSSLCLKIEKMALLSTDVRALSRLDHGINIFLGYEYREIKEAKDASFLFLKFLFFLKQFIYMAQ